MKKHILVVLAVIIVFAMQSLAPVYSGTEEPDKEQKERKHMIYLDLGGYSFLYSIGYGYRYHEIWELTVGLGYINLVDSDNYYDKRYFRMVSIPLVFSRIFGENSFKFELNAGIQFIRFETQRIFTTFNIFEPQSKIHSWSISPGVGIGLRYSYKRYDLVGSVTVFCTNCLTDKDSKILSWPGLRLGYRF